MSSGVHQGRQGWAWRAGLGWPMHSAGDLYVVAGLCAFY